MEMQLFILGHVILIAICLNIILNLDGREASFSELVFVFFLYFIPLEIIYWVLHWIFV